MAHFKSTFLLALVFLLAGQLAAQVIYGTNNYIEYLPGDIPIVISAPHGGGLTPNSIPDRTCNNAVTVRDLNTIELARQIDTAFMERLGCRPHVIICHLRRTKLDCNRNQTSGACGNSEAELAWTEYHDFIEQALAAAGSDPNNEVLYVDLHGHGHEVQRLELGYLLSGSELGLPATTLNADYVEESSIQQLVENNEGDLDLVDFLRGPTALGTLLQEAGFPSIPSQQDPSPNGEPYFSGGYSTNRHSGPGTDYDLFGLQVEANFTGVRDTEESRQLFGETFAEVVEEFVDIHRDTDLTLCAVSAIDNVTFSEGEWLYPNPISEGSRQLYLKGEWDSVPYQVFDQQGRLIIAGVLEGNTIDLPADLGKGLFVVRCYQQSTWYSGRFVRL